MIYNSLRYNGIAPYFANGKIYYGNIVILDNTNESPTPSPTIDYSLEYFTTESLSDNNYIKFRYYPYSTIDLYYSKDKTNWTLVTQANNAITSVACDADEKVYWKCVLPSGGGYAKGNDINNSMFTCADGCTFKVSGNLMSLVYGDNFANQTDISSYHEKIFQALFCYNYGTSQNHINLVDASNLVMPATNLSSTCYQSMFERCSAMVYGPRELPASNLSFAQYMHMFYYCLSMLESPIIKSTSCTGGYVWNSTFDGCALMSKLTCLLTSGNFPDISYAGVASTGTLYKNISTSASSWSGRIPIGWTITDYIEDTTQYTVTLSVNDAIMGSVSGGGTYYNGQSVSITATRNSGYSFVGWYSGQTLVSSNSTYTFTISGNVSYQAVFEVSQSSYTEVTEIKMTNPLYQQDNDIFLTFDTGVTIPNAQNLWVEIEFSYYQANGDLVFGVNPRISGMPDYCYRVFYAWDGRYFDYYNGRLSVGSITTGTHTIKFGVNSDGNISMEYDGSANTTSAPNSFDYSSIGATFLISITSIGIRNCKIWSDYTKTNLLFSGQAVLDGNNTPCLYDSVSSDFIYLDNPSGTDLAGTLTYIA